MRRRQRRSAVLAIAAGCIGLWVMAAPAQATIPASLHTVSPTPGTPGTGCVEKDAADGETATDVELSYWFCDDGVPSNGGAVPGPGGLLANATGANAVTVPATYGTAAMTFAGLPTKGPDAIGSPGADVAGNIALDVDVSLPDTAPPAGGYPVIFMMHGCCSGNRTSWEAETLDATGEKWHYNNAWFASRGYVVVNYTSRGFVSNMNRGSTGETQLDSRSFEINDFQALACNVFDELDENNAFEDVNGAGSGEIDPTKMVVTGGSYGGGFSWMALTDPVWTCTADTGTNEPMSLAAAAPRYGWTDLAYTLVPNGLHSALPGSLPETDGCTTGPRTLMGADCPGPVADRAPVGIPKRSITATLFGTGSDPAADHTTFPAAITDASVCLAAFYPMEDSPSPTCPATLSTTLPEFLRERSAYYQNAWFTSMPGTPALQVPIFNAGTLTDPLFPAYENRRMANRILAELPTYPIKQYYGDYQHFVQNKAKEWGDLCTNGGRHVCTIAAGNYGPSHASINGGPTDAVPGQAGIGVTTRLNKFIDDFADPADGYTTVPADTAPDVTAALQVCPQNATGGQAADEPGERLTASSFEALTGGNSLTVDITGNQTTTSDVATANTHGNQADPIFNFLANGGRCPVAPTVAPDAGVASYTSESLAAPATMIGATKVTIDFAATGDTDSIQLDSRLYDVLPDGTAVMVDRGPRRVMLSETTSQPGGTGQVVYELHGAGWRFPAGHRVRIEITQDDDNFLKRSDPVSATTISHIKLELPTVEASGTSGGSVDPKPTPASQPTPSNAAGQPEAKKCKKGFKLKKGKCKKKKRK